MVDPCRAKEPRFDAGRSAFVNAGFSRRFQPSERKGHVEHSRVLFVDDRFRFRGFQGARIVLARLRPGENFFV
jgi:hypothetical protein